MPNSSISLKQQQKQQLKLSPQQIQTLALLPLTADELDKRIEEEIDQNPLLEQSSEKAQEGVNEEGVYENEAHHLYRSRPDFDINESLEINIADVESIRENLCSQIETLHLQQEDCQIAKFIVGSVSDSGFLESDLYIIKSDLYLNEQINADIERIDSIRHKVMSLDPMGVGSMSVVEFLILQLDTLVNNEHTQLAKRILREKQNELANKREDAIIRSLGVSHEAFESALKTIRQLSMSPIVAAPSVSESDNGYIKPEFILRDREGKLILEKIESRMRIPRLSQQNKRILDSLSNKPFLTPKEKEEKDKLQEMYDKALRFIQSLQDRQKRLYNTVKTIVDMQAEYFISGDKEKIRPMKLEDIAIATSQDISTISRIVSQKYIDTSFGILSLRKLFSGAIATVDNKMVSAIAVCSVLNEIINSENPQHPYSDEELTKILQKRFVISRRTVAKYRDALKIKSSHERKRKISTSNEI
ncbi:MAG: RNA polymerase factor sigma-54 [Alistipes sp.]|nr:RNA polymerase factor sigma-54 [Candidatus Alistipes equi]